MTNSQRPRHTRRDANQQEIVYDLRHLGFYVLDLADVGGRVLDLFVAAPDATGEWRWLAVEIKTPDGTLTDNQKRFFEMWPDTPAIVAQCTEDVLRWYAHERETRCNSNRTGQ